MVKEEKYGGIRDKFFRAAAKAAVKTAQSMLRRRVRVVRRPKSARRLVFPKIAQIGARSARRQRMYNRSRRDRKDMKKIKCFINSRTAVHIHRVRRVGTLQSAVKSNNMNLYGTAGSLTAHENALANLRYYDPGANVLVTQSAVAGTYTRDICMSITRKMMVKNNYQVPVHVQIWSCTPKDATSVDTLAAWQGGLTDQNNPLNTSPLVYVSDSQDLKNIWNIKCVVDRHLQPGQVAVGRGNTKRFDYTIGTNDAHTLPYQKKQGGHNFLVRVSGVVAHDLGGLAQYGIAPAGIDYIIDASYTIEYDAGKDLHDYSLDDTSTAAFTGGDGISQRPVADNQSFSVA